MRRRAVHRARSGSEGTGQYCLLLAVLGLAIAAAGPAVNGGSIAGLRLTADASLSLLEWAESTLERGAGPAHGLSETCGTTSPGSASCGTAAVSFVAGNWTKGTGTRPSGRELSTMTYDPIDQYVVLFGGCGHLCSMNDTWTFAGGGWTDHTGTTIHTPSGRSSAAMTWDAKDGYVLMFGGINQSGFLQDTWGFQGGDWKNLLPAKGGHAVPPPRFGGSMVYDAADGYVVLFGGGGFYQDRTLLNDTWSYVASVWTKEAPALSPSIRAYSAMDYDASLGKVLLFGGEENTIFSGDTWEYSAGVWDHKFPGKAPSPRQGATLVYDAAISGSLLFGGMSKYGFVNDTWLFRGGNWSQVAYTGSPTPGTRTWATGAYDSSDQEVILVGGWALGTLYGDYWGFGNGTSL